MIDRLGNAIYIGWAAHEILWLCATWELPREERCAAFHDIAAMTGRSVQAVRVKAFRLWWQRERERERASRRIFVPYTCPSWKGTPSQLAQISKARLMSGRASVARRSRPLEAAE